MSSETVLNLKEDPHRRYNPLKGEWVLVSPHRTQRPWQGQVEKHTLTMQPPYDPTCYLCPGNSRVGGVKNPAYTGTFVFQNDFAALRPDSPGGGVGQGGLMTAQGERGICRVICFSPRHDLTVAQMSVPEIREVIDTWAAQYQELAAVPFIQHVQIFENRGEMMGASNPHPHCQIWANESIPNEVAREIASQREYFDLHDSCLLCDYLKAEAAAGERTVCENEFFAAIVPFWAFWPFETMIASKRHAGSLDELTPLERDGLADIMRRLTIRYDNLFEIPFPNTMGFHQRPTDGREHPECHLHAHYFPPLLRSATVRKFMVGYEMLATPQRDITPEGAASRLRELSEIRFV
jgi:UDPglucose--hexose-1-phosphate uridylyltransferase